VAAVPIASQTKLIKKKGWESPAKKDEGIQIPWMVKFRHERLESPGSRGVKLKVSKSRSPNKKMENSNDSEFCY
jgi:hypothetical protein